MVVKENTEKESKIIALSKPETLEHIHETEINEKQRQALLKQEGKEL